MSNPKLDATPMTTQSSSVPSPKISERISCICASAEKVICALSLSAMDPPTVQFLHKKSSPKRLAMMRKLRSCKNDIKIDLIEKNVNKKLL